MTVVSKQTHLNRLFAVQFQMLVVLYHLTKISPSTAETGIGRLARHLVPNHSKIRIQSLVDREQPSDDSRTRRSRKVTSKKKKNALYIGRCVAPVVREILTRMWTCRTEDGTFPFTSRFDALGIMPTACALQHLEVRPFSVHTHEFGIPILMITHQ